MAEREPRLDRLKAIALAFVLVWHLHPIYVDNVRAIRAVVHYFDFEISLTAVPTFILVSLYLFYPKASAGGRALLRRLWRLTSIFLFWTAVQTALYVANHRALPVMDWPLIRLGGPSLPIIGGSVFYYLFVLIVLTAAAWLFAQIPEPWRKVMGALIVAASLAWFEWCYFHGRAIQYWQLENFVLYVPIAFYLRSLVRYRYFFFAAYLLSAARDLYFGHVDDCVYARATVLFGALTLYSFVKSGGRAAAWIAGYSLGLYAVHKYWQWALYALKGDRSLNVVAGGAVIHVAALLIFVGTLVLTFATVALAARTPLKRFVA
jgi:hypothetical protein